MSFCRTTFTRWALVRLCSLTGVAGASIGLLTLAAASPAAAQVVYDNGGPNRFVAYLSDPSAALGAFRAAETFTLSDSITFDTVEWYGAYSNATTPPVNDAFTIQFFNTTGGVPNTTPMGTLDFNPGNNVNRTLTGFQVSVTQPEYSYSSGLPSSVTLNPGTYAISIVNDTTGVTTNWSWETTAPQTGGEHFFRTTPDGAWTGSSHSLTFRLLNTTAAVGAPEPGTLALLGAGYSLVSVGMVGLLARRRK